MDPTHVAAYQVVVVGLEPQGIRRRPIAALIESLGVRAGRPLLRRARPQAAAAVVRSQAALASLVPLLLAGHRLPASHHLPRLRAAHSRMVLVHLITEVSRSDRTAAFKDTELLLVENLRVSKALVRRGLPQLSGTHDLLRHHEVVSLRMADML